MFLGAGAFYGSTYIPYELGGDNISKSLRILDSNGLLLRECLSPAGHRGSWRSLDQISPFVPAGFVAVEDTRFFEHHGVDIRGILRALRDNIKARRIVGGGSSITQQMIELSTGKHTRSFWGKFCEMHRALRIERQLSKLQILETYINFVPFGNLTVGIEAASQLYFHKPSSLLSLGEAALLVGIPNAPSRNHPFASLERAKSRQRLVLQRMLKAGMVTERDVELALAEPLKFEKESMPFDAPHFTTFVASRAAELGLKGDLYTTLDRDLQIETERLVESMLRTLKRWNVQQAAVVVIENRTGNLLSWVGSKDFFHSEAGQVDMVLGLRQPGSALKPFVYSLGLEQGFTAESLLPDMEMTFEAQEGKGYNPLNYDLTYHGWVTLRRALACSYNIPAIWMTQQVGASNVLSRLRQAGFRSLTRSVDYYGLAIALGSGEVSLLELANAYRAIANGGVWSPVRYSPQVESKEESVRIMLPETAQVLTDILADPLARSPAFGRFGPLETEFFSAVKTGTSGHYRDNWTVGFTPQVTVGVWAGNFDGTPTDRVSGVKGAGQIWHQALSLANRHYDQSNARQKESFSFQSGGIANAKQNSSLKSKKYKKEKQQMQDPGEWSLPQKAPSLQILFPLDGATLTFKADQPARYANILFRVSASEDALPLLYSVDGKALEGEGSRCWWKMEAGQHRLRVESRKHPEMIKEVEFEVFGKPADEVGLKAGLGH